MTMTAPALSTSTGCRLVSTDGRALPLRAVDVAADAGGGLARVRLRQTFANPYAEALQVSYLLPLPADGAVVDFAFVLGGQRIRGRVERKADARAAFERAVVEGRTAAILEQERSSLFTQELGNVPPGATVEVEIDVEQPLRWVEGGWEWRWPTVVGPRYLGAPGETPHADRVTVDVADGPVAVTCRASLAIADETTGPARSPSHAIAAGDTVTLAGALDRDVVVRWPVAAPTPGLRVEVARPAGDTDAYALLTLVPPAVAGPPVARDLCLLLDTSGSMGGAPLAQLLAFSRALVQGLRTGDRLEMIAFSNSQHRWQLEPVRIDERTRAQALAWLASQRAGGGTAMHEAVTEALRPLRPDAERQVVLVTDGYIGFEGEVVGRIRRALPRGSRIHVVGVGSSVNRTLTTGVARAGGGHEAIVAPDEAVEAAVAALLARTGDPLWVDLAIAGPAVRQLAPAVVPDLLALAPARVALRVDPAGGTIIVRARGPEGPLVHEVRVEAVPEGTGRRVVATRFAREAVEDLEVARGTGESVDAAVEALGLHHRIATRLTSWVAETEEATVDPSAPGRRERMPHLLPHGVSAEGVGLRQGSASGATPAMPVATAGAAAPPPPSGPMRERSRLAKPAAPRQEANGRKAKNFFLGRLHPADVEPEADDAPAVFADALAGSGPADARPRLRARIVARLGGELVIEVTVDRAIDWEVDGEPLVVTADGAAAPTLWLVRGTTRTGALTAGQVARLAIRWSGADPVRIELGGLVLEVTG